MGTIHHSPRLVVALLAAIATGACSASSPLHPPLTFKANISLPRDTVPTGIDLLTLDSRVGRLYVSHTSSNAMDIVDVRTGNVAGSVGGFGAIKAVAVTSDPNVVFASDAGGTVGIVDVAQRKIVKQLTVGGSPDAIDYIAMNNLVVVTLSSLNQVALIDATAQKVVATIAIPGSPELMAIDQQAGSIFLAIHDKDEVVVIDPQTRSISTTFKGCDIKQPSGLAYDPEQGRLFVSEAGAELSIIDVVLDRCLGAVDIGHGTDQITFNPHLHHVYTADGGSSYISVIDSVTMKPLGVAGSAPSASTIATDPTTDMVYVAVKRTDLISVYHDP